MNSIGQSPESRLVIGGLAFQYCRRHARERTTGYTDIIDNLNAAVA